MTLIEIGFTKAQYKGKMYDIRYVNHQNGTIILCEENSGLTGGVGRKIEEDKIKFFAEIKTEDDEPKSD